MEMQVLDWVYNAILLVGGYLLRTLWEAVQELKYDLAKLREELPKDYVARNDYRSDVKELKDMLQRLFDRLDSKADKH
jgi:predicted MPP superfamily phosphohydrolase